MLPTFIGAGIAMVLAERARHAQGVAMRCKHPVKAAQWSARAEAFKEAAELVQDFCRQLTRKMQSDSIAVAVIAEHEPSEEYDIN